MSRKSQLTPYDFSHQDSLADPQVSCDGRYITYLKKSRGESSIIVVQLSNGMSKAVYRAPVKFAHPFGGGVSQLASDGETLYFVTASGGIAKMATASGKIDMLYEGPGVSQISLSEGGSRIAAVIFGDRVAVFDLFGKSGPFVVSEYPRELRSFEGTPKVSDFMHERPDFIFDVTMSEHGDWVAWHEWALPHMPWQRSQIALVELDGSGSATNSISVCAGGDFFVSQPRFSPLGKRLGFLAETPEYLRLWTGDLASWKAELVVDESFEHGSAPWGNGNRTYAFSRDGTRLYHTRNEGGHGRLVETSLDGTGSVDVGKAHHFGLSASKNLLVALRSGARTPNVVVSYDLLTSERREVERAYSNSFYNAVTVEPLLGKASYSKSLHRYVKPEFLEELAAVEPMEVPYRLFKPEQATPVGTLVTFHGGPTDQATVTFSPRNVAFLQAGFQVLTFDYRGSTGWGRSFRSALDGGFGVAEIVDLLSVLADLIDQGLAEPTSLLVNGGSSGGYSALRSLCLTTGLFCGAIAEYPLIDLAESAVGTHRFESRYFDHLLGPLPSEIQLYKHRSVSPQDLEDVPILLMHGDSDNVVDHRQVVRFVEEAERLGRSIEFTLFAGEGHGFSSPDVIEKEYHYYQRFLGKIAERIVSQSS